ncbi:MAG: MCP four helix bundle domain-containing protein, partial [Pseudomonadota bacterium]
MRNNQPVTGREHPFPQGKTVISYTNLKGQITRANEAFVELSGYDREELIGQPHNIVRHPDMPPEAFRDLWDTLKQGRPWSGLVKNRRKNGDHYWVRAYASPLADGSGYVSVRVAATREETSSAEQLYARMQSGSGIKLNEGQVVGNGVFAALTGRIGRISIVSRLWMMAVSGLAGFMLAIGVGWYGLQHSTEALHSVYEDRAVPMYDLSQFDAHTAMSYSEVLLAFQHDPAGQVAAIHDHPLDRHLKNTANLRAEAEVSWNNYLSSSLNVDEKKLADDVASKYAAWKVKQDEALNALNSKNYGTAVLAAYLKAGREERSAMHETVNKLISYQTDIARQEYERAQEQSRIGAVVFTLLLVFGTLGMVLQSWFLIRRIKGGLGASRDAANAIAAGDLTRPLPAPSGDEIGSLIASLSVMRNNLHELIASVRDG